MTEPKLVPGKFLKLLDIMAEQKTWEELDEQEREDACFSDAYDIMVENSRALQKIIQAAPPQAPVSGFDEWFEAVRHTWTDADFTDYEVAKAGAEWQASQTTQPPTAELLALAKENERLKASEAAWNTTTRIVSGENISARDVFITECERADKLQAECKRLERELDNCEVRYTANTITMDSFKVEADNLQAKLDAVEELPDAMREDARGLITGAGYLETDTAVTRLLEWADKLQQALKGE